MNANINELRAWQDEAMHGLRLEAERLEEKMQQINSYMRVLDAMEVLVSENEDLRDELERKQDDLDELNEQLEQKDKVIEDLRRQLQSETGNLRQLLLEAKNHHLESEKQHWEAEANAKPMEIHNHFESGSSSQVFNDRVMGKFTRKQNNKKEKKEKKKRWKKIARKVL